ncbi:MAG: hypothetical protein LIO40_05265 [Ruminococcus sp.]|nr:hypothetical protein [Ruminococcus sp.]
MKSVRTLTELRNGFTGKVYIYLDSDEICKNFLQDAENDGFRFGKNKPTESNGSDIIALERNKRLSYVGFAGRMAFQCNDNNEVHKIDYRKFINGEKDYLFKHHELSIKEFSGKFFEAVTIIGENYPKAYEYIEENLADCQDAEQEEDLYTAASEKFDVLVIEE